MPSVGGGLWTRTLAGPASGGLPEQGYVKQSVTDSDAVWASSTVPTPFAPVYRSGYWYDQRIATSTMTTFSVVGNAVTYAPWFLPKSVTIDALAMTSDGSYTGTYYAAVNEYINPMQPGRLLAKAQYSQNGDVSLIKTITPVTLAAGWYFWSIGNPGAGGFTTYAVNGQIVSDQFGPTATVPSNQTVVMVQDTSRGGVPVDYPTVTAVSQSYFPVVFFRIA